MPHGRDTCGLQRGTERQRSRICRRRATTPSGQESLAGEGGPGARESFVVLTPEFCVQLFINLARGRLRSARVEQILCLFCEGNDVTAILAFSYHHRESRKWTVPSMS